MAASDIDTMQHRDGVPWWQAPLPHRLHRCTAQSSGWLTFDFIERCACGAIRMNAGPWARKNETRNTRARR